MLIKSHFLNFLVGRHTVSSFVIQADAIITRKIIGEFGTRTGAMQLQIFSTQLVQLFRRHARFHSSSHILQTVGDDFSDFLRPSRSASVFTIMQGGYTLKSMKKSTSRKNIFKKTSRCASLAHCFCNRQ